MEILQQFNALIWSWSETWRAFRSRVALMPFTIYAAAQVIVIIAIVRFAYPPFSSFVAPLLRRAFGETALHYPNNFYVLRSAFGQADVPLWIFLGAATTASAVYLFGAFYEGRPERFGASWRAAGRRYLPVLVVSAIVMGLSQLLTRVPMSLWGHLADESPMKFRLLRFGGVLGIIIVQALFLYAIPAVVLAGRRLGRSLADSIRLALRSPVATFLIVAVPTALELVPVWLVRQTRVIIVRFSPEFMIVVMLIWVAIVFVMSYAIAGAATRFFLQASQEEAERGAPERGE